MGLKILHTADWHLDAPFGGFPDAQRRYLKNEQRRLPQKIADLCRRENCDLMLIAGDLFDGTPSRDTLELVQRSLESSGVPVFISPGNHDFWKPGSPWTDSRWPENVHIFKPGIHSLPIEKLDCRVYGAGYESMDCPPLLENFHTEGDEHYHIALLHGDPLQTGSPYCHITTAQVRRSGLHYLALGHIHKAGTFRAGNTLCAWPGCPMGRGWDETGSKGVCIVTVEDAVQVQAVTLDTPRFHDLHTDIGSDPVQALEALLPAAETRDFYRITLTGSGILSVQDLYEQFSRIPHLNLVDHTQEPEDLWEAAEEDSLEGLYFRMLRTALEQEPENADQIRLAAEISRKLLSGREVIL